MAYFKTVLVVTVLSDEPIGDRTLEEVVYGMDCGDLVGSYSHGESEEVDAEEMRSLLSSANSDPDFFDEDEEEE